MIFFLIKKLLQQSTTTIKKNYILTISKIHPKHKKSNEKIMTSFKGEGSRVLTGLMVEKEMTAAADSGVHELHHFNI
jgi:hypothetical protein